MSRKPADHVSTSSEQTRQKLVEAGLHLFGDHGFDGVSTRQLARMAAVNQAAILYHFGSKEGLYLAVAEAVVARLKPGLEPVAKEVGARLPAGKVSPAQVRADIRALVLALLRQILTHTAEGNCAIGSFMLREQIKPSAAFDIIYNELLEPLHLLLCQLVAQVRQRDPADFLVVVEVQSLFGQAVIFAAHRSTLLRQLNRRELDKRTMADIEAAVSTFLERQFS